MTESDGFLSSSGGPKPQPRHVTDDILTAFYQACALRNLEVAWRLLVAAENALQFETAAADVTRKAMAQKLVAAHEQLWVLFHESEK